MKRPIHETLRAVGYGAVAGTLISFVVGAAVIYLSTAALLVLALLMGPGMIGAAHLLERRARRTTRKD